MDYPARPADYIALQRCGDRRMDEDGLPTVLPRCDWDLAIYYRGAFGMEHHGDRPM